MLTPQQIDEARKANGITPVNNSAGGGAADPSASLSTAWAAADAKKGDTYPARIAKTESAAGDEAGAAYKEAASSIIGNFDALKQKNATAQSPIDKILNTLVFAGHTAGDVAKTTGKVALATAKVVAAPISQIKTTEGDTLGDHFAKPVAQKAKEIATAVTQSNPKTMAWVTSQVDAHPDIAQGVGDLFNTLALTGLGKMSDTPLGSPTAIAKSLKTDVQALVDKTGTAAVAAKDTVKAASTKVKAAVAPADTLDSTIQAVNPDLTGKKLAGAYEDVVKGSRTAKKSGLFSEQTLSPSQRAINTATRLHTEIPAADGSAALPGIALKNKPVPDLTTLADGMKTTEEKISGLLKGDPTLVYNADKPTLITSLDTLKGKSPREFGSIKDSKAVYDDVVEFAKETIAKSDDTVEGLRDARSEFDAMAKKQFPSAYKDGYIDTKTPAGIAIKQARDTINEHLYNTAPEGSAIRALIQREADIFNAAQSIAAKAAQTHGTSLTGRALDALRTHPYLSALGIYEIAKHSVAPILPGI